MICANDSNPRVLSELSVLIRGGHVRPITPRRIFSYHEIPTALQVLRSGNQIGKVVISNGSDARITVSVGAEFLARDHDSLGKVLASFRFGHLDATLVCFCSENALYSLLVG